MQSSQELCHCLLLSCSYIVKCKSAEILNALWEYSYLGDRVIPRGLLKGGFVSRSDVNKCVLCHITPLLISHMYGVSLQCVIWRCK